jgi:hypothetical protein
MAGNRLFSTISGLAMLLTLAVSQASGDGQPPGFGHDITKGSVEATAKTVLANTAGLNVGTLVAANVNAIVPQSDNPKVQPGLVGWHPTMAEACAAARRTGKPVLLFQLMGNLDERFC